MRESAVPVIGLLVVLATGSISLADDWGGPDFALGIGYAHLEIGGSSSELHAMDALRFDSCISFSPIGTLPQLRLGAAVGVSMVLDNSNRTIISDSGNLTITGSSDVPFYLFEPELRLSWRQYFQDTFYIEPGLGAGGAFGQLHLNSPTQSINKWDECFEGRAFINVGVIVPGGVAGIQASYMHGGTLDFGQNARGDLSQLYIGVFGSLQF